MADITGTELDDPNLIGTAAADTISGLGGRDHLYGRAGDDTLFGGAGNDAMHGESGADTMFGEAGNDDYFVDDVNDVVSETTTPGVDDGGKDRVYSTVSYTLSPFLERLVLLESAVAISATGNAQVNSIVGNSNANIISGGGGKDTLTGGSSADTFVLGPANAANTVNITDFATEDKFGITASDYGLSQGNGLVDNGSGTLVLDPAWFATVTGIQGTVAGHGQFLYNTTTRSVMWDADGSGAVAGIALATLQTGAVVDAGNFAISGATSDPGVGDISIGDVTIAEGNSGTKTATFTVSRSGTAAFAVDFATADGTAAAGSDYEATAGTLSFAAGQATQTVSVTINGDTAVEPDETFFLNLTNATEGGTFRDSQGLGTITNDDATVVVGDISIGDVTIAEGNSGTKTATFTVSRTGTAAFAVDFATADGTAAAGSDYEATAGTLSFAAGQATQTVSVTINGDTSVEPNETFFLNLTNATNGGTILDGQGLGTITNDDGGSEPTTFEKRVVSGLDDVEQNASGSMSVNSSDLELVDDGSAVGQTIGIRFTGIDIPQGAIITNAYIQFQVDEVSTVATSLVIRAEDADNAAAFAKVTNNVSSRTSTDATVAWSPVAWSTIGAAGLDQRTPDLSAIVQEIVDRGGWSPLNDVVFVITGTGERTAEAFEGSATGAPLLHIDYSIGTPVVGGISISDVTIAEGNSGTKTATFTVSRSGTAAFAVDFATADGTAAAGSDYEATAGTLSFTAGQATQTVSVTINGDTSVEPNETFFLNLTNATEGGTFRDSQGLGTITNDDATVVVGDISIGDVTISEGNSETKTATFTVSRTGTAAFAVDFATADGTAAAGSDYVATSGTATFAAGQATQTVSVTINGDTSVEPSETFFLNLTNATNGGTILDGQGLGTITNDDGGSGPTVVASTNMAALGSPDPAGIAYVSGMGLFVTDSEVEESPFVRTTNLWKLQPDGTLIQSFSLLSLTDEPTGLAFDPSTGRLYISDDDQFKIFWVDPANPTVKLGEFDTRSLGVIDPEDVAVNPNNGHLFIANGTGNSSGGGALGSAIIETDSSGTQVFATISLPAEIEDPEALGYDASHDVFYVGGGSTDIWVVDRSGNIIQKIDVLEGFRNTNTSAHVKDLELAPSSDPNDDPSTLNLYVADYGNSHVSDGRMIEISNPFFWDQQAPVALSDNLTTAQNLDGSATELGVQVTDSDAVASSEIFSLAATTEAAAPVTSITPTSSAWLTGINGGAAPGVTYHPGVTPPSTDMMTLNLKGNFWATDPENFVFAQPGSGPNITLQGTSGNNVILATQDVLSGGAAQDRFVFAPTSSGPSLQHTRSDFEPGVGKIDVREFSNISASALPTETQPGSDTLITLDGSDTLDLKNVAAIGLHDLIIHA
jgi:hypothetical protein